MMQESFSKRLKELRESKKLTLESLSNKISVSKMTLSRYENNQRSPKKEIVEKLADFFQVEIGYLLGYINFKKYSVEDLLKLLTVNSTVNISRGAGQDVSTWIIEIDDSGKFSGADREQIYTAFREQELIDFLTEVCEIRKLI